MADRAPVRPREQVDGLHDASVGDWLEAVDPVAYLVDEVDLPLVRSHPASIANGKQGRCRSVMVAYAVLRLRGHSADEAATPILTHRREALLVPLYRDSVEQ